MARDQVWGRVMALLVESTENNGLPGRFSTRSILLEGKGRKGIENWPEGHRARPLNISARSEMSHRRGGGGRSDGEAHGRRVYCVGNR